MESRWANSRGEYLDLAATRELPGLIVTLQTGAEFDFELFALEDEVVFELRDELRGWKVSKDRIELCEFVFHFGFWE